MTVAYFESGNPESVQCICLFYFVEEIEWIPETFELIDKRQSHK